MRATDRFPGYVERLNSLADWHRLTRGEQREFIRQLIYTLFMVWDENEALKQTLRDGKRA
jgi:hypothetical protein